MNIAMTPGSRTYLIRDDSDQASFDIRHRGKKFGHQSTAELAWIVGLRLCNHRHVRPNQFGDVPHIGRTTQLLLYLDVLAGIQAPFTT